MHLHIQKEAAWRAIHHIGSGTDGDRDAWPGCVGWAGACRRHKRCPSEWRSRRRAGWGWRAWWSWRPGAWHHKERDALSWQLCLKRATVPVQARVREALDAGAPRQPPRLHCASVDGKRRRIVGQLHGHGPASNKVLVDRHDREGAVGFACSGENRHVVRVDAAHDRDAHVPKCTADSVVVAIHALSAKDSKHVRLSRCAAHVLLRSPVVLGETNASAGVVGVCPLTHAWDERNRLSNPGLRHIVLVPELARGAVALALRRNADVVAKLASLWIIVQAEYVQQALPGAVLMRRKL
eukprot:349668-Chlamydomonas_euryale.AAC.2